VREHCRRLSRDRAVAAARRVSRREGAQARSPGTRWLKGDQRGLRAVDLVLSNRQNCPSPSTRASFQGRSTALARPSGPLNCHLVSRPHAGAKPRPSRSASRTAPWPAVYQCDPRAVGTYAASSSSIYSETQTRAAWRLIVPMFTCPARAAKKFDETARPSSAFGSRGNPFAPPKEWR